MIEIKRNVSVTQAYGCWFCLHVFDTAIYFGRGLKGRGPRLELFTQFHRFRWSKGYRDKSRVETAENSRTYGPPYIYLTDTDGHLWRGRSHRDENLHWSILEGFNYKNDPIWILRRTDPPENAIECSDIAETLFEQFRKAVVNE